MAEIAITYLGLNIYLPKNIIPGHDVVRQIDVKFHDEVSAVQQNEDYDHCESVLSMGGGFHHHGQVLNHAEGLILINLENRG